MYKVILISVSLLLSVYVCESALVDEIKLCRLKDTKCQIDQFNYMLEYLGKNGASEFDLPPIEPHYLTNFNINYLDILNITLLNGYAKGISGCKFTRFDLDTSTGEGEFDVKCDLDIRGNYTFSTEGSLLSSLLGGNQLHGDGKVKINLESLTLKFDIKENLVKGEDGELHIDFSSTYGYDLEKFKFYASKVYLGDQDVTKLTNRLVNDNSRTVIALFGREIVDLAVDIYYTYRNKLFAVIPAKKLIYEEDLINYRI